MPARSPSKLKLSLDFGVEGFGVILVRVLGPSPVDAQDLPRCVASDVQLRVNLLLPLPSALLLLLLVLFLLLLITVPVTVPNTSTTYLNPKPFL